MSCWSFEAVEPHSELGSVGSSDWVLQMLRQVRRELKKVLLHWLVGGGACCPQAIILKPLLGWGWMHTRPKLEGQETTSVVQG